MSATRRAFLSLLAGLSVLGKMFGKKCPHTAKPRRFGPVLPAFMDGEPIDGSMLNVDCPACGETVYTVFATTPRKNEGWVYFSQVGDPESFEG